MGLSGVCSGGKMLAEHEDLSLGVQHPCRSGASSCLYTTAERAVGGDRWTPELTGRQHRSRLSGRLSHKIRQRENEADKLPTSGFHTTHVHTRAPAHTNTPQTRRHEKHG